jgi:glycosyltransferase involved in cell wall biosynthesis
MSRRIAFVTNFCPHHRVKTFETLASQEDVDFLFFSAGKEWYWQIQHGVQTGTFRHEYLPGFNIGRTRIVPSLARRLWQDKYDVYIKCINGRFALPLTYLIARLRRKPFILWTGIWIRVRTPTHRLFFPLTRYIYRHADAIVVYGEHIKRYLVSEGVQSERVFIAHHAVDNASYRQQLPSIEREELLNRLQIQADQPVVLCLGRLEAVKGIDYLVNAFAEIRHPTAVLVLAGEGSERASLEAQVRQRGIADRVRFAGYVATEDAWRYYALAWTLVIPSITLPTTKETWGLVINEAFNQRVPVIASEAVGAAAGGLVQHGKNGLIVPERDSLALQRALDFVLQNAAIREHLGNQAFEIVSEWTNQRMIQGFRAAVDFVQQSARVAAVQPL